MMLAMVIAGDLSDAERRVWDAFPTGRPVVFGTGNAEDDDPAGGEGWGPDRQVRAEVLAALLCGAAEVEPGQAGEIHLDRARIIGKLRSPGATFKHRLRLERCYVGDGIDLSEATTRTLGLRGCHVGAMRLGYARINGAFALGGAHLDGKDGPALNAQGLTVTAGMFCDRGFQAAGEIRLLGASIGGQLVFSGAHLDGKDGRALLADGLTVTAAVFCDREFQADGEISLSRASIGGQFSLRGAHLDGKDRRALTADGLTVTAEMFCDEGFQADGEISLPGASIGGQFSLRGAHLDGKDGPALTADGLTVTAGMFCDREFQADGEIRLPGASIGGQLVFSGAHLDGKDGRALTAQGLTVTAEMFCDEGFQADGEISLVRAKLGALVDERKSWPQLLSLDGLTYGDLTYMPARERLKWLNRSAGYSPQPYEQLAGYYRLLGHDDEARQVLLAKQRQRRRQRPWWAPTRWWGLVQDGLAGYGYAPGRALLLLAGAFVTGWLVFRARHPAPVGPGPHPAFNAALYTENPTRPPDPRAGRRRGPGSPVRA
jgi:lactam utilization protein B